MDGYTQVSSWIILLVTSIGVAVVVHHVVEWRRKVKRLPPGPWGLPVIGSLFWLGLNPHLSLTRMSQIYGDIITITFGSYTSIALNSVDSVRETLVKHSRVYAGRPQLYSLTEVRAGLGILFIDFCPKYERQRKLTIRSLHRTFYQNKRLDNILNGEASKLLAEFAKYQRNPFNPKTFLRLLATNIILKSFFNADFEFNGDEPMEVVQMVDEFTKSTSPVNFSDIIPWLQKLPIGNYNKIKRMFLEFVGKHEMFYNRSKQGRKPGFPRSLCDALLDNLEVYNKRATIQASVISENDSGNSRKDSRISEKDSSPSENDSRITRKDSRIYENNPRTSRGDLHTSENGSKTSEKDSGTCKKDSTISGKDLKILENTKTSSEKHSGISEDNPGISGKASNDDAKDLISEKDLVYILADLVGAAFETIANTLSWALMLVAAHPEWQTELQSELDSVVRCGRLPGLNDRDSLPKVNAALHEVLRMSCVVPLSLPHSTTQRIQLREFDIPKGTFVFVNLWALHHDPKYWPSPHEFNPRRFLDQNGNFVIPKHQSFMPFSTGGRSCLGERLAKDEVFVFFAAILQRFRLRLASNENDKDFNGEYRLTLEPKPYLLEVEER